MQYSKSTGYALHALLRLARAERGQNVGIKELSVWLDVSESYLSKIMSKLRQDGIVRAVTGASGGYELARPADQITFLEVIQVVEGRQQMYECFNKSAHSGHNECQVDKVMTGAEMLMHEYLRQHTIQTALDGASSSSDANTDNYK